MRPLMGGAALALALAASPAVAQGQRDRTGQDAAPAPLPSYAEPRAEPIAPTDPGPPAHADTAGTITSVEIAADALPRPADAVPPVGWTPPAAADLTLEHRPGEPLDLAWVQRQFARNAIAGGPAARAIALVQDINRAFLSAGFVNSGLLVQGNGAPGTLSLRLVYGRLVGPDGRDAIDVTWADSDARYLSADYLRRRLPSGNRQPLSAIAIERDFRLLTEDPALRSINAQLRPGERPGEASLALTVLPQTPGDLYILAGNSRSPAVGGERVGGGGSLRNIFAGGDIVSGELGLTSGVFDASFGYQTPIFDPATSFQMRATYNEAAVVDALLAPLDISTRERSFQASLNRQVIRTPLLPAGEGLWHPSRTLSLGAGFLYRVQDSRLFGIPFSFAPGSVDGRAEYWTLRLLQDYVQRGVDQVFAISTTVSIGLDGTRSDIVGVPNPDRNFVSILVQGNYARRLTPRGLELRARLTGQWASSVLYSGERIAVGGENSVRGYRETLLLADEAVIGSAEIARPFSFSGASGAGRTFDWGAFTPSAFVDIGYAHNRSEDQPLPDRIASVGASLAWQPSDALSLRVTYAYALRDGAPTGTRDLQDDGIQIRLVIRPLRLFR